MVSNSITLTSGMRANLYSLQGASKLMGTTQKRLATGKRVNSAVDDPISFFTALEHTQRAADLSARKDEMSEAVQTIQAANTAVEAVHSLMVSAQAIAKSALSSDAEESAILAVQFHEILKQVDLVVDDAGYKGINLLKGEDQTLEVKFDESGDSSITLNSLDASTSALGLTGVTGMADKITPASDGSSFSATGNISLNGDIQLFHFRLDADAAVTLVTYSNTGGTNAAGETIPDSNFDTILSLFDASGILIQDDDDGGTGLDARITRNLAAGEYTVSISRYSNFFDGAAGDPISNGFRSENGDPFMADYWDNPVANSFYSLDLLNVSDVTVDWYNKDAIETAIDGIDLARSKLRTYAKNLSTDLSVITTRQDFTQKITNLLHVGSAALTDADMNEEGSNMLMLQTRQNLSTTALSLSAQQAQSVLRLF